MKLFPLLPVLLVFISIVSVYAVPQILISTKHSYEYGQALSFTVKVSNVTGDTATFEIVDSSGHSSSPINLVITKPISNITAPVPFYKENFLPGTYFINIQYSGANATTSFQILDTANIVIPPQFKVVADSWAKGNSGDKVFAEHIFELINSGTIKLGNFHETNLVQIPSWFKNDAKWWSDGTITDNEFGATVKYLIEAGIMKI